MGSTKRASFLDAAGVRRARIGLSRFESADSSQPCDRRARREAAKLPVNPTLFANIFPNILNGLDILKDIRLRSEINPQKAERTNPKNRFTTTSGHCGEFARL
ncbi:MAG: hypothetical protein KJO01_03860 [Gammaproteobacteria bacterium]|nr:hypothetical protein [Gammaproteobacteria bacterium]